MNDSLKSEAGPILIPDAPAIVAGVRTVACLNFDGEIETLSKAEATKFLHPGKPPIICHSKSFFARLGAKPFPVYDILELFAFVRPAQFTIPTPRGVAQVLGLTIPENQDQEAQSLLSSAHALISELAVTKVDSNTESIAWAMYSVRWPWAEMVIAALGGKKRPSSSKITSGLAVWDRLPKWDDRPPEILPRNFPVEAAEAQAQLVKILGIGAEKRLEQLQYSGSVSPAFDARSKCEEPTVVLADAGTGVGKTLGYIAPASVWAEKNEGVVWLSTYTRNLQRQLDFELNRLYPDPVEKNKKVVIRKGRENYFCLLNFSEAIGQLSLRSGTEAIGLGLMARWALVTRDGDMIGGDFPSWLTDLLGRGVTLDLSDKRGECTYSACQHYSRCFIERTIQRARHARIVVANHALVMGQAAVGVGDEGQLPTRYVFDEGHHILAAADSAFSAALTGYECEDLRRWLVGAETGHNFRSRGLRTRMEGLVNGDEQATEALDAVLLTARELPGPGWRQRLEGDTPHGTAEKFLSLVRQQVFARTNGKETTYSLETGTENPVTGLLDTAGDLHELLLRLLNPLQSLVHFLIHLLDEESENLDTATRNRIDAIVRGIQRRGTDQITSWMSMLKALDNEIPEGFVDWFSVERKDGHEIDVGLHRHYVDPTLPFVKMVLSPAHGALITSATLRDSISEEDNEIPHITNEDAKMVSERGWLGAEVRTGATHLSKPALLTAVKSPFDYSSNTKVLIVEDVDKVNLVQVASAYRELFLASGGGGLGLFTAISRLRVIHERIVAPLDEAGIEVMAQHVDAIDTGTLIDMFRAEDNSCLLGTDAVRDGIDVSGPSLRLIVFDRVPWPRPDILHRARRKVFGERAYDEILTRLKLKQAYGRLIRKKTDRGVFVMLDKAMPSRLLTAFPRDVQVFRLGLKKAIIEIRSFFDEG
ncbi:MAG: helicase [Magnetovibrio sp.]|nr:helicase [Magnetovibrio sp.]|tara:strand:- start:377 stop:3178 length:2802 start_codon:yes stop_codon:yes gene_type:complete